MTTIGIAPVLSTNGSVHLSHAAGVSACACSRRWNCLSDLPITEIELRLGYSSASAFIFMFRTR